MTIRREAFLKGLHRRVFFRCAGFRVWVLALYDHFYLLRYIVAEDDSVV